MASGERSPRTALPGFNEGERPDLHVLLSGIQMTVSLPAVSAS
jgi:hypothetical protein